MAVVWRCGEAGDGAPFAMTIWTTSTVTWLASKWGIPGKNVSYCIPKSYMIFYYVIHSPMDSYFIVKVSKITSNKSLKGKSSYFSDSFSLYFLSYYLT